MIQVFMIKPEYSGGMDLNMSLIQGNNIWSGNPWREDLGEPPLSYTFIVKTRNKPMIDDREEIKEMIRRAWEELFNTSGSNWDQYYAVNITAPPLGISVIGPSSEVPTGSGEFPLLEPGVFYMVFVHMRSEEEVTPENSRGDREDLREAFEATYGAHNNPPRIALIPIYNCSIELITGTGERRVPPEGDHVRELMRRHGKI